MKIRRFVFTPDRTGKLDFRLSYEAFRGRDPQKCTGAERAYLAALQREFERLSDPVGDLSDEEALDMRFRKLKDEGGTFQVSAKAFEKLEGFIDETPFMAGLAMQVEEMKERLTLAEKGDDKPDEKDG